MRIVLILISILLFQTNSSAQNRLEAFVMPGFGYHSLSADDPDVKDSLAAMDRVRENWGGGLKLLLSLDKRTFFQLGLHYKGLSFTRVREDLQFPRHSAS